MSSSSHCPDCGRPVWRVVDAHTEAVVLLERDPERLFVETGKAGEVEIVDAYRPHLARCHYSRSRE